MTTTPTPDPTDPLASLGDPLDAFHGFLDDIATRAYNLGIGDATARLQPELDRTNSTLTQVTIERNATKAERDQLTTTLAGVREVLGATASDLTTARQALEVTQGRYTAALAAQQAAERRLADYIATHPDVVRTQYGTSSILGGQGVDAGAPAVTKWGTGVGFRHFNSGPTCNVPTSQGLGLVHTSYKPDMVKLAAEDAATVAEARRAIALVKPGHGIEPFHEYDVKERQGTAPCDWPTFVKAKAVFQRLVDEVNPEALHVTTVSLARFWTTAGNPTGEDMSRWGNVAGDVFGVDYDGGRSQSAYPDWVGAAKVIRAFLDSTHYDDWAVPEFIHEKLPTDTDGTGRRFFLDMTVTDMVTGGRPPLWVLAFEYSGSGGRPTNPLTTTAEVGYWKGLLAKN